ncbi:Swarming motility protein YbiA [Desulfobacter hydrogenophilus]|uniref:NADAR family protein n=1 Tax=Desulfobacter hydrogenophilus TaxID=2291 RepID=A0A328FA11_9BACT|nr:NADAR family protein [Desulfobacter hydrogenophilus]NDY74346.1 NADAR family protein [Desulfobacter hydrogenophilus]QBH12472.1 NADAR family protein [Desulfobacter hydrogenophilus]RAM01504.1 Swarming motility protein YbiA [Desulfobacter hydrogenophilus]
MIEEDIYSNLAAIPITIDSFTWHSAEQFFQASKFTDEAIITKIKECSNPFLCAAIGQTREFKIREDWEQIKVSVMEHAIRARFDQHPDLADILKRSNGILYDHSAADDFWGIGANVTGKILMKIRDELQSAT